MGIGFYSRPLIAQDRTNWYYDAEAGQTVADETEGQNELEVMSVKFNEIMKDRVSTQLNVILAKGERAFTGEMLGLPDLDGKRILDIRV